MASKSKLIAIVAGVGPGTGAAIARRFAASYPVVLLARNPDNFNDLVKEINGNGGKAIGVSTDVSDPNSVKNAIGQAEKEFGHEVGAAVSLDQVSMPFGLTDITGSYFQCQWWFCAKAIPRSCC
jgi:NAD(P)-dependent dehydrogenase (short-subunit alcohol dehydrogenase family)